MWCVTTVLKNVPSRRLAAARTFRVSAGGLLLSLSALLILAFYLSRCAKSSLAHVGVRASFARQQQQPSETKEPPPDTLVPV